MYIISKHQDYYDGVHPNSKGDHHTYVREQKELTANQSDLDLIDLPPLPRYNNLFEGVVILFCGKAYPLYRLTDKWKPDPMQLLDEPKTFNSEIPAFTYQRKNELEEEVKKFLDGKWLRGFSKRTWLDWTTNHTPSQTDTIFLKYNAPVLVLYKAPLTWKLVINPRLANYNFASYIDPYTAYQEIDMYLGNTLTRIETSDNVGGDLIARDRHGFDEWSFKTQTPGEKKARRRRNKAQKIRDRKFVKKFL